MYKYRIIIDWSEHDACYITMVPELPACMAEGKTLEEAVRNTEEAIRVWLDRTVEHGYPIPPPKFIV